MSAAGRGRRNPVSEKAGVTVGENRRTVLTNARIFDGEDSTITEGHVVVVGKRIERVLPLSESPRTGGNDRVLDCADPDGAVTRVLMPGLIDAHCHLSLAGISMVEGMLGPDGIIHHRALAEAHATLMRGFTSVRDMGGSTAALKLVLDSGEFPGPRIYPSNAALSQTGGHGDFSAVHDDSPALGGRRSRADTLGAVRVVDGPDQVLAAVREQLKRGASQVKLMAGGGVTSSYDHLDGLQFSPAEMAAAVGAARDWGTYVAVHVFNSAGVRRALAAGVRSIEHGHLVDEETVALIAEHGAWLSTQPFSVDDHNFPDPVSRAKDQQVCEGSGRVLRWALQHGVRLAFGTDLLFTPEAGDRQIRMLVRWNEYMTDAEALTVATSGNAALLREAGARDPYGDAPLGVVREGAWADLLVVEGDPTRDLSVLAEPERAFSVVMKDGQLYRDRISHNV